MSTAGALHHVEVNVSSLQESLRFWEPLLSMLGYAEHQNWDAGRSYILNGTYLVFVQASELGSGFNRRGVGLNHLAFHASSREQVDTITEWVRTQGFRVLYEDVHPYAGGAPYYALYCEDPDKIKVEIVAPESVAQV
ncbi:MULTISPECIES: VOC family protein [unclassified Pseudomonas]|uniref:VOC family protein n=1 Tax=unclassified Pseudomonas TaxID=196821 RepID=UPI0015A2D778|nr:MULTISPECIES: VOC family protein [unclassified Pseudomonas]NWC93044.1 VOC family protein [Pseudomonas sp. IPO3779]NWD19462.1 VOC family protein [Pseudomonas sp. IPO3778]